jgi:hypothetical protein
VEARAHLVEALELAGVVGPRVIMAAALDALGVLMVGQGKARPAVEFFGAAARLRREMGVPARPSDRPASEDALAAARASLGDVGFDEAWAVGETLPLEQIVASAGDRA